MAELKGVSRRSFVERSVASVASAVILSEPGGRAKDLAWVHNGQTLRSAQGDNRRDAHADNRVPPFALEEVSIAELQTGLQSGKYTARSRVELGARCTGFQSS